MLNPFRVQKSYSAFLQSRITKHRIIASHPRIQLRHNETSTENPNPEEPQETPKAKKSDLPLLSAIIGIDFGNTNSLVGINEPTELRIVENNEGFRVTPTMVAYTEDKQLLVGVAAKRQAPGNPLHTFYNLKHLLDAPFEDKKYNFGVKEHEKKLFLQGRDGKVLEPVEVTSVMLNYLKEIAEGYLGGRVAQAVVSIPHTYTQRQRDLLKSAGTSVGLKIRSLIEDPVAIATSYGFADPSHNGKKILVFDMGGISLEISLVQVEDGIPVVKKTVQEWNFGGEQFDRLITEFLAKDFEKVNKLDLLKDRFATARLMEQAERVKVELTNSLTTEVNLPYIAMLPEKGPLHINMHMSRAKFENIASPLLAKIIPAIDACLASNEIAKDAIDAILISGGMTRMPKIQEIIEGHLGKPVTKITAPEEAVVMGAAMVGSKLPAEIESEVRVGETEEERDANTRVFVENRPLWDPYAQTTEEQLKEILSPILEEKGFRMEYRPDKPEDWDEKTEGKWPEVEPAIEEEVWAAKPKYKKNESHAYILYGLSRERGGEKLDLFKTLPVTLAISAETGQQLIVFERETKLPVSKTLCLYTVADNQQELFLNVIEKSENKTEKKLGVFRYGGITPAKQGKAQVNVTFDVDVDGVLTVSARENKFFARNVTRRGFYLAEEIAAPMAEKEMYKRLQADISLFIERHPFSQQTSPEGIVAIAELEEIRKSKTYAELYNGFTAWRNGIAEKKISVN